MKHERKEKQTKTSCDGLYVLPVFMKAGMHTYLVQDPKDDSYTMHTTICDFRTEQPPKDETGQKKESPKSLQERQKCL